jgi:hypothetical protein
VVVLQKRRGLKAKADIFRAYFNIGEQKTRRLMTMSDTILLQEIGKLINTQDNRCTADPMFCVQVCERIGPIIPDYSENIYYYDSDEGETYYADTDPEEWSRFNKLDRDGNLPDRIRVAGYAERWFTIQVCFTKEGCERHLRLNGHNYSHFFGTRIYVESFYRNPEMLDIRKFMSEEGRQNDT